MGPQLLLYVDSLAEIDLAYIDNIRAIFCRRRGHNSHAEVACRIKGIPVVRVDDLIFKEGVEIDISLDEDLPDPALEAYRSFPHRFQASAYDVRDLAELNFDRIETVFVRMEHLLYPHAAQSDLRGLRPDELTELFDSAVGDFIAGCPPDVIIVCRGIDVRSDDALLGPLLHPGGAEPNPELGHHGTRFLMEHTEWIGLISEVFRRRNTDRLVYAAPFVDSVAVYDEFRELHGHAFGDSPVIPFVETPAIFGDYASYHDVQRVCVGLKDLVQFYFAADRAQSRRLSFANYMDDGLMRLLRDVVAHFSCANTHISIYQSWDLFEKYSTVMQGLAWIPSMSAYELRVLESLTTRGEYM